MTFYLKVITNLLPEDARHLLDNGGMVRVDNLGGEADNKSHHSEASIQLLIQRVESGLALSRLVLDAHGYNRPLARGRHWPLADSRDAPDLLSDKASSVHECHCCSSSSAIFFTSFQSDSSVEFVILALSALVLRLRGMRREG